MPFVGVLSACVHGGLVDEGRQWLNSMGSVFGLVPKIEHYSCMVDLLARAGLLEEAWEFIEKMPEKPDAVVLGALLNACRNCKNVEIGERVINRILELEPSNSGNYVISSKIYAGLKRWDDSARMRGLMRERGISKTPGCSWIEVDGQVHEFHAGDALHWKSVEIYQMIEMLTEEMKMEGYNPTLTYCKESFWVADLMFTGGQKKLLVLETGSLHTGILMKFLGHSNEQKQQPSVPSEEAMQRTKNNFTNSYHWPQSASSRRVKNSLPILLLLLLPFLTPSIADDGFKRGKLTMT